MQVYKAYLKVMKKNAASFMIYVVIFFVMLMMFSTFGEDNFQGNFQSTKLNLYIEDYDKTKTSEALVEYLSDIHNVSVKEMTKQQQMDQLYYRELAYILVIKEGFEEGLMQNQTEFLLQSTKLPGSTYGTFVDNQINSFADTMQAYCTGGFTKDEAIELTKEMISTQEEVLVTSYEKEQVSTKVYYFFQYLPYVLMGLLLDGLAPILIIFNKKDLNNRLNCSSQSPVKRAGQMFLGCITFSIIAYVGFMFMGFGIYGKDLLTWETPYCMLNAFLYLLISVGIALVISAFSPSVSVIGMITNVIALGMSFLCGVFVPQNMLGEQVLSVSKFLPAYWYVKANDMLGGMYNLSWDVNVYNQSIVIQMLFVVGLFAAYLVVTKVKRQGE